jgi:hypothetical protein
MASEIKTVWISIPRDERCGPFYKRAFAWQKKFGKRIHIFPNLPPARAAPVFLNRKNA